MSGLTKGTAFRVLAILGLFFLSAGICLLSCLLPNGSRLHSEKYAVHSAYINSQLTGESHSLGSPNEFSLIAATTTAPGRFGSLTNLKRNLPLLRTSTLSSFVFSNLRRENLDRRFEISAKYALVPEFDLKEYGRAAFGQGYPSGYGYVTLSRVGFNPDLTEALFYTEHICGLCGGAGYVLMRKIDGRWKLVGQSSAWIS